MRCRVFVLALVGLSGGLSGAGCDWRPFDDLQNQAPVVSVKPPGNFGSTGDFGRVLLPIVAPSDVATVAARYLVSGLSATGLAMVELDAGGHASTRTSTSQALTDLAGSPIVSLAEIPGSTNGTVLMGAPGQGSLNGGQVLVLSLIDLTAQPFTVAEETSLDFGIGVAAGNLVGAADADYVILNDDTLRVYPDPAGGAAPLGYPASAACPITLSAALPAEERQSRAVVIANWGGGPQIAVGTPAASGSGSVSIFSVGASGVTCAFTLTEAESGFGRSVVAGDFDGDGVSDLLVGAPPDSAYVFFGPLGAGSAGLRLSAPSGTIAQTGTDGGTDAGHDGGADAAPSGGTDAGSSSGVAFGSAVAAVNVDGTGGDEVVVGDLGATVGGQMTAGQVTIFSISSARVPSLKAQVSDRFPKAAESYGASLGALRFCPTGCAATDPRRLLLVGAAAETFTFFKIAASDPDPRTP